MAKRGKKQATTKKNIISKPLSVKSKKSIKSKSPQKDEEYSPRSMRNTKVIKLNDYKPRSVCSSPKKITNYINEVSQIKINTRTQSKKKKVKSSIKINETINKGKKSKNNNKGKNKKQNNRNNKKQKEDNEKIIFENIDIIETDDSKESNCKKKEINDLFSKEMNRDLKEFIFKTINDSIKILSEEQKKFFEDIKNGQEQFFVKTNESILNVLSLNSNNNNSVNNEIKKEKIPNSQI